ncbi:uncharacterized protein DUF2489 [Tamilnaduibacter salinus]|uniref:Uncharacterized protein DUF2489 n=1 Tax=Tamilnaduibacter salinus TaxID=1484056 RepID=A0A2A2I196_9GAMM|nr:DUF2489 domain-containing protein [Tamilnaduibacter salinus]PAV25066.1 hypothetical protein CF392_12920 [Tamilnaduibacter salinus]PVY77002.1 uncharacterized protein DUF2489 [Tamilnaduibacter salinus]
MPGWLQWGLILAGLAAIAFLARFITQRLRAERQQQRSDAKTRALQKERRDSMVESIRVLAMAVEQDQMEYSEACLRIKGLLDHVKPELLDETPYRIFREIHERIEHMPTHEERQQTDRHFVRKMDKERFALEQEHADAIRRAATAVRHHPFD